MRQQEKRKLIRKMNGVQNEITGGSLYVRPFQKDEQSISEIARATGERKSAVAQKLLHLALRGKQIEFADENREKNFLDWIVNNEKHKAVRADALDARLERLEEHAGELENTLQIIAENSRFTRVLASEIYCATNVCMSYLNQIFTKIIEYFSPVEIERKNSADFANLNVAKLIEHAVSELENLSEYHNLDPEEIRPETLYLFTKIEQIKARLSLSQNQSSVEQNNG